MGQLTSNQKKEYLRILLLDGKAAAQQLLDKAARFDWIAGLPTETLKQTIRFMEDKMSKGVLVEQYSNVLNECLKCCPDEGFAQCLEEGEAKIASQNTNK